MSGALARWDARAGRCLRTLPHHPALDRALVLCSRAQERAACWIVLGLAGAAVDAPHRRDWLRATAVVAITEAAAQAVKRAVGRSRPADDELGGRPPTPSRYSFPSAHTATASAAAMTFPPLVRRAPVLAVAAATGVSRPYVGVHYPSDVLAGAALGTAISFGLRRKP